MDIDLPLGTPSGTYDVRIVASSEKSIFDAATKATLRDGFVYSKSV
jgi:hypothetical protein